ncbi:hypothetical protein [Nocardia acidivorans]|uniref:hypothetical protein n=1 Tax=Nocardia acidivorans TaxID=404580 RepID=UPI00082B0EB1|nr:hypothetical protein [Nocardia acidivorans]
MVQSTPSPAGAHHEHDPQRTGTRPLSEGWPYLAVALANSAVLYMMFKPWLRAYGWDGTGTLNGFGRFRRTTRHINLWSHSTPPGPDVSSVWAVLATVAILVTVVAAIRASRHRGATTETLTAVAASAVAVLVAMDVYTLNAAIPQVGLALSMNGDLSTQVGMAVSALRGTTNYPWPGKESKLNPTELTPLALIALSITVVSASIAVLRARRGLARLITAVAARIL